MPQPADQGTKKSRAYPKIGSVILMSWEGGFTLAQLTSLTPRHSLIELGFFPDASGRMRWAVRCWKVLGDVNPTREFKWCLWLPLRTEIAAKMAFDDILQMNSHKRAMRAAEHGKRQPLPQPTESQMRFLAKTYPRTIALMRNPPPESTPEDTKRYNDALRQAYVEEVFAFCGILVEPTTEGEQVLRMALV
jgi:hypothetical protein